MHILETKRCNTEEQLLSREEMMNALGLLVHRMDAIDVQLRKRLPPLFARDHDQWIASPGGSWVGGFWSGMVVVASTDDRISFGSTQSVRNLSTLIPKNQRRFH